MPSHRDPRRRVVRRLLARLAGAPRPTTTDAFGYRVQVRAVMRWVLVGDRGATTGRAGEAGPRPPPQS